MDSYQFLFSLWRGGKTSFTPSLSKFLLILGNFSRLEKFRKRDTFSQKHVIVLSRSGLKDGEIN